MYHVNYDIIARKDRVKYEVHYTSTKIILEIFILHFEFFLFCFSKILIMIDKRK